MAVVGMRVLSLCKYVRSEWLAAEFNATSFGVMSRSPKKENVFSF